MEDRFPHAVWLLRMTCDALQAHERAFCLSAICQYGLHGYA